MKNETKQKTPPKLLKKIVPLIILFTIVLNIGSVVFQNQKKYFSFDYWERFQELEKSYYDSQYATKNPTQGWISDAKAYTYAGGALITGTNPIHIIPDAPPLGKYLIGLSALLFNNENIFTLVFASSSLFLLYLLSNQIFKNKTLALLPPLLWSFEPLFKDQLANGPLFDIFQLSFLLLTLYFFTKGYVYSKDKPAVKYFILSCLFLGLFISTKYFISGLIMVASGAAVLFLKKQYSKLIYFLSFLTLSIFILLLTYVRVFSFGYGLREYLGIQKWIFLYHQSQFILPFSIWPLVMLNKWYVWFGDSRIISDENWTILWPIITVISFLTIGFYFFKRIKQQREIEILLAWTFFFFLFFSFGQIFSRYLVAVIPVMYVITVFALREFAVIYLIPKMYGIKRKSSQ